MGQKKQKKILIVGDSELDGMLTYIAERGRPEYEIIAVENGLKALKKAEEWKPDVLVLAGTHIPGLDGLSLCEAVHTNPALRGTRIILSSGHEPVGMIGCAFLLGASDFLPKPFDHKEALAWIVKAAGE